MLHMDTQSRLLRFKCADIMVLCTFLLRYNVTKMQCDETLVNILAIVELVKGYATPQK